MSRRRRSTCRSASICITLFGALTNSALTLHVLSAWQQLKWGDVESEWAGDSWPQVVDGVKVMWALLSLYFISAASVCAIGFVGSIRVRHCSVHQLLSYSPCYRLLVVEQDIVRTVLPRLLNRRLLVLRTSRTRGHLRRLHSVGSRRHM
jgi:hypothetical protein